jgi:transcriptional regulator with XRE-family HTH domain
MGKGFTYKSYSFVDKDPIIDEVRGVFDASGATYKSIEEDSGVTYQTMRNWFEGKTRRPQAATINAVLRALGKKLGIVDIDAGVVSTARRVIQLNKVRRRG